MSTTVEKPKDTIKKELRTAEDNGSVRHDLFFFVTNELNQISKELERTKER